MDVEFESEKADGIWVFDKQFTGTLISKEFDLTSGELTVLLRLFEDTETLKLEFDDVGIMGEVFGTIDDGKFVTIFGRDTHNPDTTIQSRTLSDFEIIDVMKDPRIPERVFSDEERMALYQRRDLLNTKQTTCAKEFKDKYKTLVLAHCLQTGLGDNIGGGCFHLMPYFVTPSVEVKAIDACTENK